MTASQAAKRAGFKSLKEVAAISGKSTQTLNNLFNNQRGFFNIVLMGCRKHTNNVKSLAESRHEAYCAGFHVTEDSEDGIDSLYNIERER